MDGLVSVILIIVVFAISAAAKKESAAQKKQADKPKYEGPKYDPPKDAAPKREFIPKVTLRREHAPKTPERRYYDSDCETAASKHDHDRRIEQLDGFLKCGVIGREEYLILKDRYSR